MENLIERLAGYTTDQKALYLKILNLGSEKAVLLNGAFDISDKEVEYIEYIRKEITRLKKLYKKDYGKFDIKFSSDESINLINSLKESGEYLDSFNSYIEFLNERNQNK